MVCKSMGALASYRTWVLAVVTLCWGLAAGTHSAKGPPDMCVCRIMCRGGTPKPMGSSLLSFTAMRHMAPDPGHVHVLLVFIALPMHIMRADGGPFRYLAFPPSFKGRDIGRSKSEGKQFVFTPGGTLNSAVNPTQWHLYERLSCVSTDARAPPH